MRLCYIADPHSIHTRRWIEYFVQQGYEVYLLSFYNNTTPIPGVTMRQILPSYLADVQRGRGWLSLLFFGRVHQLLKEIEPDILHAHFAVIYGWLAALSGFHPLVLTLWGGDILPDQGAFKFPNNWLTPFALKRVDLLTGVSQLLLKIATPYTKSLARRSVIRIGANLDTFKPEGDDNLWRTRLNLNNNPIILSPRPFEPVYNVKTIVEAIPYVLEKVPGTQFLFKDNPDRGYRDQFYRDQILQKISDLKVKDAVTYVGNVPYQEMAAFYRMADVVVSMSLSDGVPVTLLEAMACGTPIVVGQISHLDEFIINRRNALTVPVNDPQQLTAAIVQLLQNETLRETMIAVNFELVRTCGDFESEMKKMEKLYKELI